jgi:hypothetical protein
MATVAWHHFDACMKWRATRANTSPAKDYAEKLAEVADADIAGVDQLFGLQVMLDRLVQQAFADIGGADVAVKPTVSQRISPSHRSAGARNRVNSSRFLKMTTLGWTTDR